MSFAFFFSGDVLDDCRVYKGNRMSSRKMLALLPVAAGIVFNHPAVTFSIYFISSRPVQRFPAPFPCPVLWKFDSESFNRMARPAGILVRCGPHYSDKENFPPPLQ